jgi:hypothetical protein
MRQRSEAEKLRDRESARISSLKNPEKVAGYKRRYAEDNPEKVESARKAWRETNPEAHALSARKSHLKTNFGITIEVYDAMLLAQKGRCKICGGNQSARYRYFDVDHDHVTLKVRGLLCRTCNRALGYFERDLAWLKVALAYLGVSNEFSVHAGINELQ